MTPPAASITSDPSSITFQAATSGGGPKLTKFPTITIANADPAGSYFFSLSYAGTAINEVTVSATEIRYNTGNPATASGNKIAPGIGATLNGSVLGTTLQILSIGFPDAVFMGAGTYTDTINVRICTDAACSKQLAGSPIAIPVTYTVTGNPIPASTFTGFPESIQVESASSASTAAPTVKFNVEGGNLPPAGAFVLTKAGSGGLITGTSLESITTTTFAEGNGVLTVQLKAPATVGAGIYSDTVQISICFDLACTKPGMGSPWTVAIRYVVDATAGTDFTAKTLALTVSDIVWNPVTQQLYALVPAYSSVNPNTITQIDPATATIVNQVSFSSTSGLVIPGTLALSDDGQFLYAGVSNGIPNSVQRVLVAGLTLDLNYALPNPQQLRSIRVAPGLPHTVALVLSNPSAGVVVYDDSTQRPQTSPDGTAAAWGADATTLFSAESDVTAGDKLNQFTVTGTGLSAPSTTAITLSSHSNSLNIHYVDGTIYWDDGSLFNLTSHTQLPSFAMNDSTDNDPKAFVAAIDSTSNRAYFITPDQPKGSTQQVITLESFNLSSRQPLWLARFPSQSETPILTRWGSNGLAIVTSDSNLVLISGDIVIH